MTVSIHDHQLPYHSHNIYDVTFFNDRIRTLVTSDGGIVNDWISNIEHFHRRKLRHLIVGLDVEWRPSFSPQQNPVAILQLCVGHRCLIFQIIHAQGIPPSLANFLYEKNYRFMGVGIEGDVNKLENNYGLEVRKILDLRDMAAEALENNELRNAGLKALAWDVLTKEVNKRRDITLSAWDARYLSHDQVIYACLDAFLSFEIGRVLNLNLLE